jgi:hypothetical protein
MAQSHRLFRPHKRVPIKNIKIYIIISINKTVTTEVESVKNSLA